MIDIQVKAPDVVSMLRKLREFREDQVPFALSLAMNRAAKDARDKVKPLMARVFKLRSTNLHKAVGPFGALGGRTTLTKGTDGSASSLISRGWSHRSQWPSLRVVFGSESHGLQRQEEGGEKPNRGRTVWIPTQYVKYSGAKKIGRHTPSKLRRAMETKLTKTGKVRKRSGAYRVFQRNETVFERDNSTGETRPLYLIRTKANVPPRMDLEGMIRDTYKAKLWPRFVQAMDKAAKTAKSSNRFTERR